MGIDTFANMTAKQKDAVAKLRKVISSLNTALADTAATGIEVEIDTVDVTALSDKARTLRIAASVRWPSFPIA